MAAATVRMLRALAAVLIATAAVSCTPGTRYSVYNNTQGVITIRIGQQAYSIGAGAQAELDNWHAAPITVETETAKWSYSVTLPAFHALTFDGGYNDKAFSFSKAEFAARRITIQVNGDGRVFVVPPEMTVPIAPGLTQPDGFPLLPIAVAARPNSALVTDACVAARCAAYSAAKRGR